MIITIDRSALADAVSTAARFAANRSPLPILHTVRIGATPQSLTLSGTDLENGVVVTTTAAHTEKPGELCIDGALLDQVLKQMPKGEARLEQIGEGRCVLSCGLSRYELSTLPAADWPDQREDANTSSVTLSQPVLKQLISQAVIAAADSATEARAVMFGVLLSLDLDRLTLVATDGRRMSVATRIVEVAGDGKLDAVIHSEGLRELGKALSAKGGTVTVTTGVRRATFALDGYEFSAAAIQGKFPDYTKVVPTSFSRWCRFDASSLLAAVKRLLVVAKEKRSPGLLRLGFSAEEILVTANTPDLGSGEERVPCEFAGEPLTIGFNGRYLADGLVVLGDEEAQLDLQSDTQSAVLRSAGDQSWRYVLMPVKLRDVAEDYEAAAA